MRFYTPDPKFTVDALLTAFEKVHLTKLPEISQALNLEPRRVENFFDEEMLYDDGFSLEEIKAIESVTNTSASKFFPNERPIIV